ncbi:50S ribosomal protein L12, apicoplast, putative [Plasmodium gallinaceum]|uniref:50S ribosomal protein L12, apicoplast, putative n=1 Tax=Plasmodium gallinaceum TaxID=5849 RepID=A0A1J1GKV5_PLAGA|nr:50S ribosomal protein L12, apicoplast, putative [Plasmodium gallinaceum]CRG93014.1 50S ribosomal protein L12, apicoplast, putative [Plasmodium gallinaceum]
MKSKGRMLINLIKKKVETFDNKKRCKFAKSFKKIAFPIFFFFFIIHIYFIECVCFKLLREQNKFNCDNYLFNKNKVTDHYSRKNDLNYRNIYKKSLFNYNRKFKLRSEKVDNIIESLKKLTLLEASELVKKIELTFSVDTKQNVDNSKNDKENKPDESDSNSNEEEEEENKVYDLILENIEPNKKIPIIKIVKEIKKDLNLKQAKDLVDNLPQTLFEKINKETADKWKAKLTEAGGTVKLK